MASIFSRIFGRKPTHHVIPNIEEQERKARQQADRLAAARALSQRAAQGENLGRQQAAQAHKRGEEAARRGDREGQKKAREDEQRAIDFARKQRQEREEQARRARDAEYQRQQAVIEAEQGRAKAREALLKTRKEMAEAGEWGFQGPAPKSLEIYKNIKTGEGQIPDQQMFLLGHKYDAFASSNVIAMQYDARKGEMYIQYVKSGWYRYLGFTKAEAIQFYAAASKGVNVWDRIRVRGENPRLTSPPASTRKRFERNSPPPADLPLEESSAAVFGTQ